MIAGHEIATEFKLFLHRMISSGNFKISVGYFQNLIQKVLLPTYCKDTFIF